MKKHWDYLKYLIRHKWFVYVAGRVLGVPWWRLVIHDWSKFMPSEWFPYVEEFYGDWKVIRDTKSDDCRYFSMREPIARAFDKAWLHHQHFNPHHWQHWILRQDNGETITLQMPKNFALEMVADWYGAGRAITGKWEADQWFEKNKSKISLHSETKSLVLEQFRNVNLLKEQSRRIGFSFEMQ